jgi:hypothetical protein
MSSTPIYDELAAIHLADLDAPAPDPAPEDPVAAKRQTPVPPAAPAGGRRRRPETGA